MRIEIGRRRLALLLAAAVFTAAAVLGLTVSPRDAAGRPVLLLPGVRQIERYRDQAREWRSAWQRLSLDLHALPAGPDLLAASQAAQAAVGRAQQLAAAVDGEAPPPALIGLHDQALAAAQAFTAASLAGARWLSAPTPQNRAGLSASLQAADSALSILADNPWLTGDGLP